MSRSKNNSKNTGKNTVRPYTVMCTDIYLLWILVFFPLYYADGYFHLPEKKAMFWTVSTLVYVIVCLVGAVITAFSMREHWSMENFKKNITMTDIFMFGFLISNLIALAISDDPMGSWVGANARYYGARVLILVCVVYFLVSRYAWINQVFIVAFLIGGNGVCLLATFDYFGMDVLGINKQMQASDWLMFISTMGNANTCASYVTMAVAGAMCYFCVAKSMKAKVFAAISVVNCSMALITARSDSAFVGIAITIIFLGVCTIMKKVDLRRYIATLTLIDIGILGLLVLRKVLNKYLLLEWFESGLMLKIIVSEKVWVIIFIILALAYSAVVFFEKGKINFSRRTKIVASIVSGIAIVILLIVGAYKFNLVEMIQIGMGNDIGSRSYIYQRMLQTYEQLPLTNKILGCGQATVSNALNRYFGNELSMVGISINSAHSNILDYLITLGLLGAACCLGVLISIIKHNLIALSENKYVLVFGGCAIAYFAQGLFNIDQTNTTTIYWLMVACCEAMYRQSVMKKENY